MGSVIVGIIVVAIIAAIVLSMRSDRKKGKHSCGGTCGGCPNACNCHGGTQKHRQKSSKYRNLSIKESRSSLEYGCSCFLFYDKLSIKHH